MEVLRLSRLILGLLLNPIKTAIIYATRFICLHWFFVCLKPVCTDALTSTKCSKMDDSWLWQFTIKPFWNVIPLLSRPCATKSHTDSTIKCVAKSKRAFINHGCFFKLFFPDCDKNSGLTKGINGASAMSLSCGALLWTCTDGHLDSAQRHLQREVCRQWCAKRKPWQPPRLRDDLL